MILFYRMYVIKCSILCCLMCSGSCILRLYPPVRKMWSAIEGFKMEGLFILKVQVV